MAYNALNNLIDAYIYPNGVQAITGSILNNVLKAMVSQLGGGYNLMGVAAPASSPAVNDEPQAYFAATAGTYTNFGGITLSAGEVAVLLTSGNGSWSKQTIYNVPTGTADLVNTAGFITNAVDSLVNYYAKAEIDAQKAETDAALGNRYTKTETDAKLADYYKKTETYDKDEVDSIVAALSRQEYIVAWDGSSAPVVADIPAGVTVTYSGTPYTGTLAASASTVNKIYMVWNGVASDMYGTSADGGYSWVPMGTTSVDLSQYATKTELDQLSLEVDEIKSQKFLFENGTTPGYIALDGTQTIYWPYGYISAYIPVKAGTEVKVHGAADTDNLVIAFYDGDRNFYSAGKVAGDGLAQLKDYSSIAAQDGFVRCYTDNKIVLTAWEDSYFLVKDEAIRHSDVVNSLVSTDSNNPLSANAGRIVNEKADGNAETLDIVVRGTNFVRSVDTIEWENGTFDIDGNPIPSNNLIRDKHFIKILPDRIYSLTTLNSSYTAKLFIYSDDYSLIKRTDWGDSSFYTDKNGKYLRVVLSRTDDARFSPESATGVSFDIHCKENITEVVDSMTKELSNDNSVIGQYVSKESVCPAMSPLFWEQGTISSAGQDVTSLNRLRTINKIPIVPSAVYFKSANMEVITFDVYGNVVDDIDYPDSSFTTSENAIYARLSIKNSDGSRIKVDTCDIGDYYLIINETRLDSIAGEIALKNTSGNIAPSVNSYLWEYGTLVDGEPHGEYTIRLRTKDHYPLLGGRTYQKAANEGFDFAIDLYDANKNYLSEFGYGTEMFVAPQNAAFFKLLLKKDDGSAFSNIDNTGAFVSMKNMSNLANEVSDVRTPSGFVPYYYEAHLANKIKTIQDNDLLVGSNGDSFVFITDTHYETNALHSPALIRRILERTNVRKVFHGGDVIDWGEKDFSLSNVRAWYEMLGFTDVFLTLGNHDINITEGSHFTNREVYALFMRSIEGRVNISRAPYYYFDNANQKIRYIVLDGHWPNEPDMRGASLDYTQQLSWLDSVVGELDNTWGIVVFQHIIYGYSTIIDNVPTNLRFSELAELLIAKLDTIQADSAKPSVLAVVTGHTHYDYEKYSENGGYPIIVTTTDSTWGFQNNIDVRWAHERELGTIDEQAFDVIQIDRSNKKIYCTRIGYGNDRVFTMP